MNIISVPLCALCGEKKLTTKNILSEQGIERLYSHQAEAINFVREGRSIIVVTSASSVKTGDNLRVTPKIIHLILM